MDAQQASALYDKVKADHDAREARWARGEVTISEVVERMTCPACDNGIDLDGKPCEFCHHGLTIWPGAANALRTLAQKENDGIRRLIDELMREEKRREGRRAKKATAKAKEAHST